MNRRTAVIFYLLSVYVIVQFSWWGFHLIELTKEVSQSSFNNDKRVTMILGEGAVFILLVIIGLWRIKYAIKKDLEINKQQKNFMLSVTHELKTPLAANRLYLQTIQQRELSKEQQKDLLQSAVNENERLERMIDNILNASRLENRVFELTKEDLKFNEIVSTVLARYKMVDGINFNLNFEKDLSFKGDRFLMETILNNLIDNAVKYGKGEIEIYGEDSNDQIVFGVSDNGPGVLKKDRENIFQKFYRSEDEETRSSKGTGLGLFIISEIVLLHNGKIEYIHSEDNGANFRITLN